MRHTILLCVALAAPPALAEQAADATASAPGEAPSWRITLRGGMNFVEDRSFDVVTPTPFEGASEIGLDLALDEHWWVGASFRGGGALDRLFDTFETDWQQAGGQLHGLYRWWLVPGLAAFGRLGVTATYNELRFTGPASETLDASAWTYGLRGGLGLDYLPISHAYIAGISGDLGVGVSFELTYARDLPLDLEVAGLRLGALNTSGPGWLTGLVFQW